MKDGQKRAGNYGVFNHNNSPQRSQSGAAGISVSFVLSVVKYRFKSGAWARAACRSSADEPRGGMSVEDGRLTEIGVLQEEKRLCDKRLSI